MVMAVVVGVVVLPIVLDEPVMLIVPPLVAENTDEAPFKVRPPVKFMVAPVFVPRLIPVLLDVPVTEPENAIVPPVAPVMLIILCALL